MRFYRIGWPYSWQSDGAPFVVSAEVEKETPKTFVLVDEDRTYRMTIRKSDMERRGYHPTREAAIAASLAIHEQAVENGRERWVRAQKRVALLKAMR